MSNKKVLMLALICGLLTAVAVNFYLKSVKDSVTNVKTRKVAVAVVKIPTSTVVTPEMVAMKDLPEGQVHASAVGDVAQVAGYTARAEIEAGEQILSTKLVPKEGTGPTLAYVIPQGMRAMSIAVDDQAGVAGLINPGDYVDVLGTAEVEIPSTDPTVNTIKRTKTHMLMQNVRVLAVGKSYATPGSQPPGQPPPAGGVLTLAVPADQVQFFVAVMNNGKITLALRAPGDKSEEPRPSLDAQQLLR